MKLGFLSSITIGIVFFSLAAEASGARRRAAAQGRAPRIERGSPPAVPAALTGYEGRVCHRGETDPLTCMVCNVYYESRGESYAGKVAVARVVLTRVRQGTDASVCRAIYRQSQFSWTLGGSRSLPRRNPRVRDARRDQNFVSLQDSVRAAREAIRLGSNGLTHFHTRRVNPRWARSEQCRRHRTIGTHHFYQCYASVDEFLQRNATLASNSNDLLPELYATSGSFEPEFMAASAEDDEFPETRHAVDGNQQREIRSRVSSPPESNSGTAGS